MKPGPFVTSSLRGLGIGLDSRGLLPLAEARRRVRRAKVFERGKSHVIPNQAARPTDADFLWAALLSLESAEAFVREASRLTWKFSPRGDGNVAPLERYGEAILPWLARFVDGKGRLAASPSCVFPCLLGIGNKNALEILLRIRRRAGKDTDEAIRNWLAEHGEPGWKALADLASLGHPRANEIAAKAKDAAPAALTEAAILHVLDRAAASTGDSPLPWPALRASAGHFELHALRLIAVRARQGDDWGVLFEAVQGDVLAGPQEEIRWPATVQQYRYGSRVPSGGRYLVDARPIRMHRALPPGFDGRPFAVPTSFEGVRVVGPKGTSAFDLTDALVKKLRLEPGRACSPRIEDWPSVIALRGRLARDPAAFWSDPKATAKKLLAIADPIVLVATDRFEHSSGPGSGARGNDARLPSETRTFRSIATAIVHRDAELFDPGVANAGWCRA